MKKTLIGLGVAACVFGFTGSAFAVGQGGIAGAASFQLTGTAVDSASAAVAIGKSTATAGAATDLTAVGATEAFAAGTGGLITYATGAAAIGGSVYIASIAQDTALATPQSNILSGSATNITVPTAVINQTNP